MSTHLLTPLMETDEDLHVNFSDSYTNLQPNVRTLLVLQSRNTSGMTSP